MKKLFASCIAVFYVLIGYSQLSNISEDLIKPVDGKVYSLEIDTINDILYVGGSFKSYDPLFSNGAEFDLLNYKVNKSIPRISEEILVSISDGNGGWIIGGENFKVGGIMKYGVAHIYSDGTVDPWEITSFGIYDKIMAMEIVGDELYVGGVFNSLDGQSRTNLASYDLNTKALTSWAPVVNSSISSLKSDGDTLYIGGSFSAFDTLSRSAGAAVLSSSKSILPWDPKCNSQARIWDIEIYGDTVFIGGDFLGLIGAPFYHNIALLDNINGDAFNWNISQSGIVKDMLVVDDFIYVVGELGLFGSIHEYVRRYNLDSNQLDVNWKPEIDNAVNCIKSHNDQIIIGGDFDVVDSLGRDRIAVFSHASGSLLGLEIHSGSSHVNTIAVDANSIFIGGQMTTIGGDIRNNILSIDLYNGEVTDFELPLLSSEKIYDIELSKGADTVYVGGWAYGPAGIQVNTKNIFWDAYTNSIVRDIEITDSLIYVGGSNINGSNNLTAYGRTTGNVEWVPNINGVVYALEELSDTALAIGGTFSEIDGVSRIGFGSVSSSTHNVNNTDLGMHGNVKYIKETDSSIFVSGFLHDANYNFFHGVMEYNVMNKSFSNFNPQNTDVLSFSQISDSTIVLAHTNGSSGQSCINAYNYYTNA